MSFRFRLAFVLVLLFALCGASLAQTKPAARAPARTPGFRATFPTDAPFFYLKDGDRVVFYGDSITDQRLYTTFVESYVVTRFPHLRVSFVHSGWGGDRVTGGGGGPVELRLERDVIPYNPTVVTVMLGMNDGRYRSFDKDIFATYQAGMENIVRTLKGALPGVRMTLIQPSPYDDVTREPMFEAGYNAVLLKYSKFVKELALDLKLNTADLNTPVVAALEKAKAADPELAKKILPDRVHPGAGGHLLMAAALLKAWHAPATVSSVRIDVAAKNVPVARNARVYDLNTEKGVSWMQNDFALPFWIDPKDPVMALAVKSSDVVESLDKEMVAVAGLAAGKYELKIDGDEIGTFSSEQLGEGINLATMRTPMSEQAHEVHELTLKHNNIHFARWRTVQVPLEKMPGVTDDAIEALDKLDFALIRAQHAAAQPRTHRFELVAE